MATTTLISRRELLRGTGALVVSFGLFGPETHLLAQAAAGADAPAEPDASYLDSWLAVHDDGTVTFLTSKVDLGTGVITALTQIVAEELDVAFDSIHMDVGDTAKTVDQFATVGSRTIERGGPQVRQAAAAARLELLKMASLRFGVPMETLSVTDGVISGDSGKKVSYAQLVGGRRFDLRITATGSGWDLKVAPEVKPKDPKTYHIVGKSVPRIDLPAKFTGEFTYAQDVRIPGMLHGRVVRPPVVNSKPLSVEESSIKNIAGIVKVVQQGDFLGVVAQTEWAAIQAAKNLKVEWAPPTTKLPANSDELYAYLQETKSFRDLVAANTGNPDAALAQVAKTYEASYRWPFQMHGMIGPSCAVADVQGDRATIWTGTQGPFRTRKAVAEMLGVPEKNVRVIYREGSGCYGRLSMDDVPEDAAVMSRAVGRPVRVQWMREDEHGWEPKGPAQFITVRAGVDGSGKIVAWDFLDRSFPWTESGDMPLLASRQVGLKPRGQGNLNGTGGGGDVYAIENQRIVAAGIPWVHDQPTPLRTSNLRAPGELARCYATESFIDEIAVDQGADPVEFRLRYVSDNKRVVDALRAATEEAQWKPRLARKPVAARSKVAGRGVAIGNRSNTITAAVADVEVDPSTGRVRVTHIVMAHDCGLIVNPDGLRNQVEGNVIQGVSRTLFEQVDFDSAGVKNLDWDSYPIITFNQVPDVDVILINRPEMPSLGGGEPSIVAVPAAISNAIFDAVGIRLREVPLTPERVLAAIKSAASAARA